MDSSPWIEASRLYRQCAPVPLLLDTVRAAAHLDSDSASTTSEAAEAEAWLSYKSQERFVTDVIRSPLASKHAPPARYTVQVGL